MRACTQKSIACGWNRARILTLVIGLRGFPSEFGHMIFGRQETPLQAWLHAGACWFQLGFSSLLVAFRMLCLRKRFVFRRGWIGGWRKVERRIASRVTWRMSKGSPTRDRRQTARTLSNTFFAESRKWICALQILFLLDYQNFFLRRREGGGHRFFRIYRKNTSWSSKHFPDRVWEWWGKRRGKLFCPPVRVFVWDRRGGFRSFLPKIDLNLYPRLVFKDKIAYSS